jgi:ATP-dependent DNA ligase
MSKLTSIPIQPMEARSVDTLPDGEGWQFEPKWDGFRCLAVKQAGEVALFAKSGKPLGRYFPDMLKLIADLPADDLVLDGELTIPVDGRLSFDALQMRLHPAASRVNRLAAEHPAVYVLFDLLVAPGGETLAAMPLEARRSRLEQLFRKLDRPGLRLSPVTTDRTKAEAWLAGAGGGDIDGVIAKRTDEAYAAGDRAMLKIKRIRTADCVVGGFRYGTGSKLAGSLLLGLYDDVGRLNHVGYTTLAAELKRDVTERLELLRGGPGFTGNAPGGPSRWSTERTEHYEPLRHELVVEVSFDHVSSDRFRHGTRLLRWRPDKRPDQCTMEQLLG